MAEWKKDVAERGKHCSQLCRKEAAFVLTERGGRHRMMFLCKHHYRLFLAKCNPVGDKVAIVGKKGGASGKVN